ncbi:DMT family transporter [Prosthecodimorpha staleyi]|uniref:DMT family transporter n=1 Tax=Prosthecodimorpha staleyi TaxID=2840188 RepID=A0A947GI78_9HYPH|nr:DMT family transporter [Prosthecodimorpha staleyi]MBT9288994.1 DMT family transporter [Prosthecodimorpha staleyi]
MTTDTAKASPIAAVAALMAGALLAFVGAALSIRVLSGTLPPLQINIVRTGGGLLLLLGALAIRPSLARGLDIRRAYRHIPRNIAHASAGVFWTVSIGLLPLATVFSLEFTAPAWAALLAFPILGEKIGRMTMVGIFACIVGVLIILRPSPSTFDVTALLPLCAALGFGLSVLLTRRLTRTETTFAILFWMMVIQLTLNAVGSAFWPGAQPGFGALDSHGLLACLTLAVSGLLSQLCLSRALHLGEALLVMPLDFLRVPLIAVIGYWVFGEPLDIWVFIGFGVIAGGIVLGLMAQARKVEETAV